MHACNRLDRLGACRDRASVMVSGMLAHPNVNQLSDRRVFLRWIAEQVEELAHALLAAERPPNDAAPSPVSVTECAECADVVAAHIVAERQRTCALLLEVASKRHAQVGPDDPIVRVLAVIGNELVDPDR